MAASPEYLDVRYGVTQLREPRDWERTASPISVFPLNSETASFLIATRDYALSNPFLLECITNLTFLWIVSEEGILYLSLERSFETNIPDRRFPRTRGVVHAQNVRHLGHPMLAPGWKARNGGELYLDQVGGDLVWTLSNKSGRYGVDRTVDHLINASQDFANLGVLVALYLI